MIDNSLGGARRGRVMAALCVATALFILLVLSACGGGGGDSQTSDAGPSPSASALNGEDYSQFADTPEDMADKGPEVDPSQYVAVSDLSVTTGLPRDWTNILLIGEDWQVGGGRGRADTMIIASINNEDGRVKLASVQRDTIVDIPGIGRQRLNSSHQYGGPELTMKMINEYFGMNIESYVTVNFLSFPVIVERLGGITMDITEAEWKSLRKGVGNSIFHDIVAEKETGRPMPDLDNAFEPEGYGVVRLTGRQTLAYARIRSIDSDFARSLRQRKVLMAILLEVKGSSISELTDLAEELIPSVVTNLKTMTMISLAIPVMARNDSSPITAECRLPVSGSYEERRDLIGKDLTTEALAFFDTDFAANRNYLYDFIYN